MSKYIIVWNEKKRECVIFLAGDHEDEAMDEAMDDAYHAGGGPGMCGCGVSSLADSFREIYGECQPSFIQHLEIDSSSAEKIIKDGE